MQSLTYVGIFLLALAGVAYVILIGSAIFAAWQKAREK